MPEGARVVAVPERGYGAALIGGIRAAHGRFVIMGDADDSYDFSNITPCLHLPRTTTSMTTMMTTRIELRS